MYGADEPDTFWLNFTNIALGLVTLACVITIASGVLHQLAGRRRRRAAGKHDATPDDHAFVSPGLGLTMADGGERIDEARPEPNAR